MYHAEFGRFCGRDPIGYAGTYSLHEYGEASPVGRGDPSGFLSVTLSGRAREPSCRRLFGSQAFLFSLSGAWPCRTNVGFFVNHVRVHCFLCDCSTHNACVQESFQYWEALMVTRRPGRGTSMTDTVKFGCTPGFGHYRQNSTMKFFCLAPPGSPAQPGEITQQEVSWQPSGVVNPESPCRTTSGVFPRTTTRPSWWGRSTADPPAASRRFAMYWNCCCDRSARYAYIQTRP